MSHNVNADDAEGAMLSAAKYQKKRCLLPTSSQPVCCSTGVAQRSEVWHLMRREWSGETWLWKTSKSREGWGDEVVGFNGFWGGDVAMEVFANRRGRRKCIVEKGREVYTNDFDHPLRRNISLTETTHI